MEFIQWDGIKFDPFNYTCSRKRGNRGKLWNTSNIGVSTFPQNRDSQPMTLFMFVIFFRLRELNLLISTVKMWHFVRGTLCPVAFCPWDILSCGILSVVTFCPVAFCPGDILSCGILSGWHFVLWHFVRVTFCPVAFCPVTFCPGAFCPGAFCPDPEIVSCKLNENDMGGGIQWIHVLLIRRCRCIVNIYWLLVSA